MNNNLFVLFLLALVALSSAKFVYDKRLLKEINTKKQIGRDFSGSERYGSFIYNGPCPTGEAGDTSLTGISINAAVDTTSYSNCFSDSSTGAAPTIGFICQPGAGTSTIHFGFPGSTGFVIGGTNFVAATVANNVAKSGWTWGIVGTPSYGSSNPTCTATCTSDPSCGASYCSPSCTATCTAGCTATDNSLQCTDTTTTAGTVYFVPSTAPTPSNCGSIGTCCSNFNYPGSSSPPPPFFPCNDPYYTSCQDFSPNGNGNGCPGLCSCYLSPSGGGGCALTDGSCDTNPSCPSGLDSECPEGYFCAIGFCFDCSNYCLPNCPQNRRNYNSTSILMKH